MSDPFHFDAVLPVESGVELFGRLKGGDVVDVRTAQLAAGIAGCCAGQFLPGADSDDGPTVFGAACPEDLRELTDDQLADRFTAEAAACGPTVVGAVGPDGQPAPVTGLPPFLVALLIEAARRTLNRFLDQIAG